MSKQGGEATSARTAGPQEAVPSNGAMIVLANPKTASLTRIKTDARRFIVWSRSATRIEDVEEAKRRLEALQRYVKDRETRQLVAAALRMAEVRIGELLAKPEISQESGRRGGMPLMTPHVRPWWRLHVVFDGPGPFARMRQYGIVVRSLPLLWFIKGTRVQKAFVEDVVFSPEREKDTHPWQKSTVEAEYYISRLVPPSGLVFDPFCGGGTTAIACHRIERKFITCDIDADALAAAKRRFHDEMPTLQHGGGVPEPASEAAAS